MNFEEKTLTSECVYKGKIIDVLKDDVEISTGRKSVREVVKHSGGVVICAIKQQSDHNDKILLVRQFRYPIKKNVLELPAGKLEKGEIPLPAAKRELEEETGYTAQTWKELGFINTSPGFSDEKLYLFLAQDLKFTNPHPDEGEIIECEEYLVSDVLKMIKENEINDAKTICTIFRCLLENAIKI